MRYIPGWDILDIYQIYTLYIQDVPVVDLGAMSSAANYAAQCKHAKYICD